MVVVRNYEPKLSYMQAELLNKFWKQSCFPNSRKLSALVPVFKNVGERSIAKNSDLVSVLFVVSKVLEKLVNNTICDHLERLSFF